MIKAKDAIAAARALIGTPYAQLDCINLVKKVIRTAPGGVSGYTTAGTNALWDSYEMSAKYRDLTWRQESISGAKAGMLAFKRQGDDVHHVGIVTGEGTVIHSSSTRGGVGVIETALDGSWHLLAVHRHIETEDGADAQEDTDMTDNVQFRAVVQTASGALNMREAASTAAGIIGRIPKGAVVDVYEKDLEFWRVGYGGKTGWCAEEYLSMVTYAAVEQAPEKTHTSLISEDGVVIVLKEIWRVAED